MHEEDLLRLAMEIAARAHAAQKDKLSESFIEHVARVAAAQDRVDAKIVAYLHDVVEKNPEWHFGRLSEAGFPDKILAAVDALTRREGESDLELARRAAANPLALPVKLADLNDNLQQVQAVAGDTARYVMILRHLESETPQAAKS